MTFMVLLFVLCVTYSSLLLPSASADLSVHLTNTGRFEIFDYLVLAFCCLCPLSSFSISG